jgi:glyoxylase-like metal-dependent hydrolase (beta-lactamase superfamily II)
VTKELAPLAEALPDGVLHAELPTPFPVGPVNCWLLPAEPVTLIDPGMVWADSVARVERLLAEAALGLGDVERIVVTHGHPDHYGLAGQLARTSGARIFCGAEERPKLLSVYDRPRFGDMLAGLGVPDDVRSSWPELYAGMRDLIDAPDESALDDVTDGEVLALGGRDLHALITPGHASGHLSLWESETGILFSGDHLLPRITPNPVLESDSVTGERRRSLVEYLASLDRFVALDPRIVLPGHGPAFHDVGALVKWMRTHHERRAEKVLDLVKELGEPTPFALATALFPALEGFGVMLGVSEAVGHLDLLVDEGVVEEHEDGSGVSRYRISST